MADLRKRLQALIVEKIIAPGRLRFLHDGKAPWEIYCHRYPSILCLKVGRVLITWIR